VIWRREKGKGEVADGELGPGRPDTVEERVKPASSNSGKETPGHPV